eukprot:TRINITY_DN6142_c1_g1_i3.p1 TRINITY_DN6142_c1_g1~~TRINITY_DN6142_c1_g1_i3.p1  ORF type:complete len:452 (-),score=93.75 TRINITY_DN6142_c1_g1_i3:57-1268(-)
MSELEDSLSQNFSSNNNKSPQNPANIPKSSISPSNQPASSNPLGLPSRSNQYNLPGLLSTPQQPPSNVGQAASFSATDRIRPQTPTHQMAQQVPVPIPQTGGSVDHQFLIRLQAQFEKILKSVDNIDYRLNRLETVTREIINNQKSNAEHNKKYRHTVSSHLEQIKQVQQQHSKVISSLSSSTTPKPNVTSTPSPASSSYYSGYPTTPTDNADRDRDRDLELAKKLQAQYDSETKPADKPVTVFREPAVDADMYLARQLQAQFDEESIVGISELGKEEKKETKPGLFSKFFGSTKNNIPKKEEKDEPRLNKTKQRPASTKTNATPTATATPKPAQPKIFSAAPSAMPNQMFAPVPTGGFPYFPQIVYPSGHPMPAMQPVTAPFPTTQAGFPQQPQNLYYLPPQ